MKKVGILMPAFFMLTICNAIGQVYFDELYGSDASAELIPYESCLKTDNGYFVMTSQIETNWRLHFFQTNLSGVLQSEFNFPLNDSLSERGIAFLTQSDTTVLCLGYWQNLNQSSSIQGDPSIARVGISGSLVWRRIYGQQNQRELPERFIRCYDGGVAIVGQAINGASPNADGQAFLLRIDAEMNQIFDHEYGGNAYETAISAIQTPDQGFLLLGWTRSFGNGERDFYLVKTDSLGEQEWQQTYGDEGDEGGSCIIALNDGNYMLTGGGWNATATGSVGRLYKIDPLGQVIWSKIYEYDQDNYLFKTIELEDGSLVSTGLTNTTNDAGWLIKTDSEGNELWQRKYNKNENTDLFYSVLLAEDGGFLLSGQARNAETGSQDAWLLKVDSVGCPYPNCLVGVDEAEPSKVMVDVWPNPTSEVLNLELQQQGMAEVQLYDMAGKLLFQKQTTQQREAIDASTFENGLYLLAVVQGEMKTTVKVMVQH